MLLKLLSFSFSLTFCLLATATSAQSFLSGLAPGERAQAEKKVCVLEKLGWKFSTSSTPDLQKLQAGKGICDEDSPESAHNKGQLLLPSSWSYADFQNAYNTLVKSDASFCAFKMKHKAAIKVAVQKIRQAERSKQFGFHSKEDLPGDHISGPNNAALPAGAWKKSGSCALPKAGLSNAIEAIYSEHSITECATGLQIANLAVVWELFGSRADQLFSESELRLDTWSQLIQKPNFWYENNPNNTEELKRYAKLGPNALVGLSGVTSAINPERVDNVHDTNENLLLTEVSKDAAEVFARSGAAGVSSQFSNGGLFGLGSSALTGTSIYVHPLSNTTTLSELRSRLRSINPKTRYHFSIYSTKSNSRLFEAFLKDASNQCP